MSELQYYEFRAIDRPLTEEQQDRLREMSSRAEITAYSFTNEYHYGDFRGDTHRLMREFFDAHLYYANWGTHRLAFRLPAGTIDLERARPYCNGEQLSIEEAGEHVVVWFDVNMEAPDWDEVEADLASLLPVRDELLRGDLRPLYLGWLGTLLDMNSQVDNDEVEPPVPPGLSELTAGQEALADFLWLTSDLLEVAARASGKVEGGPDEAAFTRWLANLPAAEKDRWLLRLASDQTPTSRLELRRLFDKAVARPQKTTATGRTVGELLSSAENIEEERLAEQARKKEQARNAELDALARRGEKAWGEVDRLIQTKQPKSYDQAVGLLKELKALAERDGKEADLAGRLAKLRQEHARKGAFIDRLDRAKLP